MIFLSRFEDVYKGKNQEFDVSCGKYVINVSLPRLGIENEYD